MGSKMSPVCLFFLWQGAMVGVLAMPFGYDTCTDNNLMNPEASAWGTLELPVPFVMNGVGYTDVKISTNGVISLDGTLASHSPQSGLAAPFLTALWQEHSLEDGMLLWRSSQSVEDLEKVQNLTTGLGWNFQPSALAIFTWSQATSASGADDSNTYQVVLATDGTESFAIFHYMDLTFSEASAVGGFNKADGTFSPARYTGADMKFLQWHSNSGTIGQFVYKTSGAAIEAPVSTVSKETCSVSGDGTFVRKVGSSTSEGSFDDEINFVSNLADDDLCKYLIILNRNADGINFVKYNFGIHRLNDRYQTAVGMDTSNPDIISGKRPKDGTNTTPYYWENKYRNINAYVEGNGHIGWLIYSSVCPLQLIYTPGASDGDLHLSITSNPYFDNLPTAPLCT